MLVVKNSYIKNGGHIVMARQQNGLGRWLWWKRECLLLGYSLSACENSGDIFLEDYFCDLDNPTDIELSLLELEHGIIYLKDE